MVLRHLLAPRATPCQLRSLQFIRSRVELQKRIDQSWQESSMIFRRIRDRGYGSARLHLSLVATDFLAPVNRKTGNCNYRTNQCCKAPWHEHRPDAPTVAHQPRKQLQLLPTCHVAIPAKDIAARNATRHSHNITGNFLQAPVIATGFGYH